MIARAKNIFKDMGNGLSHAHQEGFRRESIKNQRRKKSSASESMEGDEDANELHIMSYPERAQASG